MNIFMILGDKDFCDDSKTSIYLFTYILVIISVLYLPAFGTNMVITTHHISREFWQAELRALYRDTDIRPFLLTLGSLTENNDN